MAKGMARRWPWVVAAALVAIAVGAMLLWPKQPDLPTLPAPAQILLTAAQGLDEIDIDARFDPATNTLDVQQVLTLVNRTGVAQSQIVLRTYANAFRTEEYSPAATDELHALCYPDGFSEGGLTFTSVKQQTVQNELEGASYAYGDEAHTVLNVTTLESWESGETVTLHIGYQITIPDARYRFGRADGIWMIGNALVIPAPFVDGAFLTDEYYPIGDPFISECSNYTVRITAPQGYTITGSAAAQIDTLADGMQMTRFDALAVREFALCIGKDVQQTQVMQSGVLVQAYATTTERAATLAALGAKALTFYQERYGAYPYPSFTLSEVQFPFGGMEYPAMTMIAGEYIANGGDVLEQLIAHEVAHQWWYAVVGSDQFRQAWQDEALAQFSVLEYWQHYYGQEARDALQFSTVETAMRVTIPRGVTPGSPLDYFGDLTEYAIVVYNRGAAALCALDTAMQGNLYGFLRDYYAAYAFGLPSRNDFESSLAAYSGEDWSPLLSDYLDTYLTQ